MAEVNSTKFYTAEMKKREEEERRALADKATKVFHQPISTLNIIPAQDPAEVRKAAAQGEVIKPDALTEIETGADNWIKEYNQFRTQTQKDQAQRDGVWQEPSTFNDYHDRQGKTINRLQYQADSYLDFFDSHRDLYGDELVDDLLSQLDTGGKGLKSISDGLRAESEFRGQFLDQDEFDTYQRLSVASAEGLKAWNEELGREIYDLKHHKLGSREETKKELARIQQTRNRVLNRYYELDNKQKLAELAQDSAAQTLYQTADLDTADLEDMVRRMQDRLDRGGRPEEDPAALEVIRRELGISPERSGSTAQYMNDLLTASTEYINDTADVKERAARALAGMGYDYERLSGYQQTQKDAERYGKEQAQIKKTAQEHPFLSSAATWLASPGQAVEAIDMAIRGIGQGNADDIGSYVPLNVYNMSATNYVSGTRGAVAEKIAENTEGLELLGVNVPSFIYQTTMSMGDSALHATLLGPTGLAFMGGEAAANQMQDIIARGGNNRQVLLGGLAAGIAEAAFEKFSLENFLKPKTISGWKSLVKETAKQAGIEASEEVFTEIANILSDTAIMGRDSSAELAVRAYMMQGMSEEEARTQLFFDQLGQVAEAGAGGLLSGIGMGGASSAVNYALGGGQYNAVEPMQYRNKADNPQSAPAAQTAPFGKGAEGQAGLLTQAARDVAAREMAEDVLQETAQSPTPQAAQNITPAARTAQEGAQSAKDGIQRAGQGTQRSGSSTNGQQRTGADTARQQRTRAEMDNASALVKASEVFGENGQKAFAAAWDGQGDSTRYYAGFATWYQAGLDGKSQGQVRGPYAGSINEAQRLAAYNSGQRDAAASLGKEKAAAPYAKTAGTEAGLYDAGGINADIAGRMDAAAKLLGTRVYMVDNVEEGRKNGRYGDSDILIAKDAANPAAQVFGHEVTHRVQELAPETYRAFRQAALDHMADSAARAKIEGYQAQGETIKYEAAMDDVAADYAGQLMEDGGVLDEFINRHRTDKTLLEKLRDAFRSLWQKLTGAEKRKAQTAEGKLAAALDAAAERADSLSQAAPDSSFAGGTDAGGTEGQGSEEADGSKYSLKGATITKTYNQLLRENDALRERVEYWRGQTKTTKEVTVDKKAVEKASKDIIKEYGAGVDDRDLSGRLQALYNHMARTWYTNGEVENSDVWKGAEEIARDIAGGAVEEWSLDSEFPGLKEKLRDTRISVGREYDGDIQNENFRREYRGKLNLTSKEGTNVDTVYSELSEAYPGLFPADITHPADQLEQIMSVADSLYTVEEQSRFSGQMEEAVTGITNEIVEKFMELPLTKGTFADWQAMKMDKLRSENREAVQNAIAKERAARENQVNELKKKYKARTDEGRERQKASDLRKKIDRHAKSLSGKLLHPTDKSHIPEELRGPVAKVLESINLESQYTIDPDTAHYAQRKDGKRGGLTGKHLTGDEEARGILTKRTQAFLELKQKYADINENGGDLVIDPTLLGSDEGSIDAVIAMGDTRIADMNSRQLNTVWQVVKAVEHSVSTAGKTLNQAKYERTSQWADALKRDTATRRDKRTLTERHMTLDLENPYTFFSHFGQAGKDMYRTLRDAQDRQQVLTNQVADAVGKAIAGDAKNAAKVVEKTVKKLEEKTGDFTTEGGQKLTLSTAQVMELYELMKREQAREHLLVGGIVQPEIRGTKVRRGTEAIHLTANDLANITGTLTAEEKRIADGLQKIASTILSDMGNEASMTAYGYKKFTDPNYWTIRSSREALHSDIEKGGDNTRSIKNIGMAQATKPHANNQVDIGSIFDTFARHTGDMVDYAAWLVPMEDLNRVYNYQYRDGDGTITDDVKKLLDRKGGAGSQKYWHNLMEDIQNGIKAKSDSPFVDTFSKGVGKFKASAVGGNIRVIVQQPTALFRAAAVMNPADMAAGLVKGATKGFGWQKALKYSPIAMRKDAGGFDISSPGTMKETLFGKTGVVNKINDLSGKPAGAADAWTWGKLWNASEWQVARQHKELTKGSKAFYEEVNRVFTDMIDQTQVVDGILQRSNIMRTSNAMGQQATSFMGEPIMSLNLTMRAWDQLRNEQDSKKRGKAIKNFGRAVTALTVTAAANAVAQSLIDAIRDDDKDKKYWERFRAAFTGLDGDEATPWEKAWSAVMEGNLGSNLNPAGQIPYIKDIQSLIQGYDVSRTELSVIQDLIENGQNFIRSADGHGAKTQAYALNKLLASAAKVFGLPVANLERDIWALARSAVTETGNLPAMYEMEKAIYNIGSEKNKSRFTDIMYRALEAGEMDTYHHIQEELMNVMGVDGAALESAMKSRYKSHLEKDPDYTLPQRSLDLLGIRTKLDNTEKEDTFGPDDLDNETYQTYAGKRADSWRSMSNNIVGSNLYKQLSDAEKDKAMDYAWEYAHQTALADVSGGKYKPSSEWIADAREAAKRGVQPWEFALYKTAYGTEAAYSALEKGNLGEYKALRGKYMDVLGKDGTSIDSSMRSKYEDKLEESPHYTLNQPALDLIGVHPSGSSGSGDSFGADDLDRAAYDAYTTQRSETYRETVDYIEDLPSYQDMDQETQDKLVSMAYTMAHQTALADNSGGQYSPTYTWVRDALDAQEDAGIEAGEFLLWRTAYNMAFSDKDANGKAIKGREKKDKVKAWLLSQEDLTPEQRAYLWGTEYKSAW